MIILLCVFLGLMALAVTTTVFELRRAKDGYEDETGFHLAGSTAATKAAQGLAMANYRPRDVAAQAGVADAARTAATELPSGLLSVR